MPAARSWADTYGYLARNWRVGEHMTLVGTTGSGKTTFAREALMLRDWVVVLATKIRDKDLFQEFTRQGYVVKQTWSPFDTKHSRVIFAPPLPSPTREGRALQAAAFRKVLIELFQLERGNWTVYSDEIAYLTNDLRLQTEIDTLYLQGRSLGVTLVASTQRPRSIPRNVFAQATWFGLWRIPNAEDRASASDLVGGMQATAREAMRILPQHEMLLVNVTREDALRTKVYTNRT
jgi:ABC-type dipeptide/oligopeptide/nickel transport system ATPase component